MTKKYMVENLRTKDIFINILVKHWRGVDEKLRVQGHIILRPQ